MVRSPANLRLRLNNLELSPQYLEPLAIGRKFSADWTRRGIALSGYSVGGILVLQVSLLFYFSGRVGRTRYQRRCLRAGGAWPSSELVHCRLRDARARGGLQMPNRGVRPPRLCADRVGDYVLLSARHPYWLSHPSLKPRSTGGIILVAGLSLTRA
ncbi:hypothetical protein C8F04DRAFT_290444 [Mycena alexandri]|uniref:Uncharacterized protein n=1 Tax=Mycena alexandri TaxID=1745969 RepID=A0AAD6S699_9AGAR|nr:hypothetical protein C8F04DRAFT_290444 [Mycena alexandri]